MRDPSASVIITNFNYADFLPAAIDSALNQGYGSLEVIVVDDGSTDDSQRVLATYKGRVKTVLKENGGQASAFNAGFAVSSGDIICFLDADDILLPHAIENAAGLMRDSTVVRVHWPLLAVDADGKSSYGDKLIPDKPLPDGDLRHELMQGGISGYITSPTSGNAWSRSYLEQIFPLNEEKYRFAADGLLSCLAPLYGMTGAITGCQSLYRIHGHNNSAKVPFKRRFDQYVFRMNLLCEQLNEFGVPTEGTLETWKNDGYRRLEHMTELGAELGPYIPPGHSYILLEMNEWAFGTLLEGRKSIPFLEKDGMYWGAPSDDDIAIQEFDRLRGKGASYIVFGYPAFWYLDHYVKFNRYLRTNFECVLGNEHFIIYKI